MTDKMQNEALIRSQEKARTRISWDPFERLTLTECARALPKIGGRRIHASSLWRWCRRGLKGERLRYRKFGGRIVVTLADVDEFTKRLAAMDDEPTDRPKPEPKPIRTRTSKQRDRDIEAAQRTLREAGIT